MNEDEVRDDVNMWRDLQLQPESINESIPYIPNEEPQIQMPYLGTLSPGYWVKNPAVLSTPNLLRTALSKPAGQHSLLPVVYEEIPVQLVAPQPIVNVGRTVCFYFFVNRGSGGRLGPLLLDLDIDEVSFGNYLDKNAFPDISNIKMKICPLNDPDTLKLRMQEVQVLSRTSTCRSWI